MKLDSLKKNAKQSANFMFDFIGHVIRSFGKRDCGSQGERDAVAYMADAVKPYADSVVTEPYDAHPLAFMGCLQALCAHSLHRSYPSFWWFWG